MTTPSPKPRRVRGAPKSAAEARRSDIRWGFAGMIGVVLLAIAFGLVYYVKIGITTYTAELSDAGSIRTGDEIRVAGIKVADVKSVELQPDHVEMTFTVDNDVFVGDQTTLDVRMLTIVGGHYLALAPAGTNPLGATPIPQDRVTLPYSLPRVFQDAVTPVKEIDGEMLRQNFAALQASFDGHPQSFETLLSAVGALTDLLQQQNADVSRTLKVADEYLNAFRGNLDIVARLINSLNLLEDLIENNIWAVTALEKTAVVVDGLATLGREWKSTLEPMAQPLADSMPTLDELGSRLGQLLESVKSMIGQLQPLITPTGNVAIDQSAVTVPAPALCIPVPGREC